MAKHTVSGVEVDLDDDVDPNEIGQEPVAMGAAGLDPDLLAEAVADDSAEDDEAGEV